MGFICLNNITFKNMSKTIYRIENPTDKDGMWYTKEGILRKKIHIGILKLINNGN